MKNRNLVVYGNENERYSTEVYEPPPRHEQVRASQFPTRHSRNPCGIPGSKEEPAREINKNFNSDQYSYSTFIPPLPAVHSLPVTAPFLQTLSRRG